VLMFDFSNMTFDSKYINVSWRFQLNFFDRTKKFVAFFFGRTQGCFFLFFAPESLVEELLKLDFIRNLTTYKMKVLRIV
jgi:hypothetical protein